MLPSDSTKRTGPWGGTEANGPEEAAGTVAESSWNFVGASLRGPQGVS
jgi:hypothetical protein